jgi:anti-sigma factor RsiW
MPGYKLKCQQIRPLLSAYLDRELPIWKIGLIRLHLRRCPGCACEVAELQRTSFALRIWGEVRAPAEMRDRIMSHLQRSPIRFDPSKARWRLRIVKVVAPLTATIITLIWFLTIPFLYHSLNRTAPPQNSEISVRVISESELIKIIGRGRS